jgi:superfamily II DNA helicase RecQ
VQDTYRKEWADVVPLLRSKFFKAAPILSLSATMSADDVLLYNRQMHLTDGEVTVVRAPADKRRIFFTSQHKKTLKKDVEAIAAMIKLAIPTEESDTTGPAPAAIIYFPQKGGKGGCIDVARTLAGEYGLRVGVVHGRNAGQTYADVCDHHMEQRKVVENWKAGEVDVIAATCAFGLGIDHPNVQLVVLYGLPASIQQWWQYCGRLVRAGTAVGQCSLFYRANGDLSLHCKMASSEADQQAKERKVADAIRVANVAASPDCIRKQLVEHIGGAAGDSGELAEECAGCCSTCVHPRAVVDYSTDAFKIMHTFAQLLSLPTKVKVHATLKHAAAFCAGCHNEETLGFFGSDKNDEGRGDRMVAAIDHFDSGGKLKYWDALAEGILSQTSFVAMYSISNTWSTVYHKVTEAGAEFLKLEKRECRLAVGHNMERATQRGTPHKPTILGTEHRSSEGKC